MRDYTPQRNMVSSKIRQYGGPIQVVRPGTFDDVTGEVGPSQVVGSGYAIQSDFAVRLIDGDKIKVGDKLLLVEADVEIGYDDKVVYGNKTWSVIRVMEANPNGQLNIVSKVQVRS